MFSRFSDFHPDLKVKVTCENGRTAETKESGDREKKPRRRTESGPVITVIWEGDAEDWKAAVLWLYICDAHKP